MPSSKDKQSEETQLARTIIKGVHLAYNLELMALTHIRRRILHPKLQIDPFKIATAFDNLIEKLQNEHLDSNQFRTRRPPLIYASSDNKTAGDLLIFDSSHLKAHPDGNIPLEHGEGLRFREGHLYIWSKIPAQPFPMGFEVRGNRLPSNLPGHGKAVALWAIHYLGVKL